VPGAAEALSVNVKALSISGASGELSIYVKAGERVP